MKTISRNDLNQFLNDLLKVEGFPDSCPNGLQVEGKDNIKKIAFAVSASKETIEKAIAMSADALIVHHGIFWEYQGARPITGAFSKRVAPLIKHDLNLFAYHLPLDGNMEVGNAAMLAERLKLDHVTPFGEYKKNYIGVQGKLTNMTTAKQLKELIREAVHHEVIISSPAPTQIVNSVAIVTGGGARYLLEAEKSGVDAFITGEMSEYHWNDAQEGNIHLYAAGHTATETLGIQALMKKIHANYGIESMFIPTENPI